MAEVIWLSMGSCIIISGSLFKKALYLQIPITSVLPFLLLRKSVLLSFASRSCCFKYKIFSVTFITSHQRKSKAVWPSLLPITGIKKQILSVKFPFLEWMWHSTADEIWAASFFCPVPIKYALFWFTLLNTL